MKNEGMERLGKDELSAKDSYYINVMRGLSILRVVLVHLGLSWFYPPYSQYIGIFLPVLFFVSGAVSYYSFLRAQSVGEYLVKRLVLVLVPFYVFAALVLLITVVFYPERFPSGIGVVSWLLVWPNFSDVFFPLNQVWFINCLVVMILISGPIFFITKKRPWLLWGVIIFSLVVSLLNVPFPLYAAVSEYSFFSRLRWGHQAWQVLVLLGLFICGSVHYRYLAGQSAKKYALISIVFLIFALMGYFYSDLGFELKEHAKQRSLYYLFLSFFAIYFLLALERPILRILARMRSLEWLLLYTNRYAYSVYLSHTLVLFYVEQWLGLTDLGGQPFLALVRMFLVLVITLAVAKPLGDLSRTLAHTVRAKLLNGIIGGVRT
ncbi:acyltransferase family protein [Marinobacter segnicrescens]|uniref:acyltransferase family protein n=1 Tax=Marinobacter segnicrescens TaxID=430453 RepID=UPI003A90770F